MEAGSMSGSSPWRLTTSSASRRAATSAAPAVALLPRAGAPSLPRSAMTARPLRILVAEDNPINQLVAVRLLEKHGHTVVVAGNGREAVAAVQGGGIDLVLMDVQMPEMDGLAATAAIRAAEAEGARRLPILALR